MKTLFFSLFFITNFLSIAQQKNKLFIKVGNQLFVKACKVNKPEFVGIEIYSRNEIYDKSNVDSLTGKGLSQAFFSTKSLDGKRLPCSMGGRAYTIAAIDTFTEKGITHNLVLLYDYYPLNLIMVDYESAVLNNEVELLIKQKTNTKRKKRK
jgi:hypothetical protein